LQALHLLLELLVTVLQLFEAAGELADRSLEAADAGDQIGVGHLRARGTSAKRACKEDAREKGYEHGEGADHHQ
jgi:hypothetical protein